MKISKLLLRVGAVKRPVAGPTYLSFQQLFDAIFGVVWALTFPSYNSSPRRGSWATLNFFTLNFYRIHRTDKPDFCSVNLEGHLRTPGILATTLLQALKPQGPGTFDAMALNPHSA